MIDTIKSLNYQLIEGVRGDGRKVKKLICLTCKTTLCKWTDYEEVYSQKAIHSWINEVCNLHMEVSSKCVFLRIKEYDGTQG